MTKQKHFYLIRGLVREHGHWHDFGNYLKTVFPYCLVTTIDLPGAGDHFESPAPITVKKMVDEMRRDYLSQRVPDEESCLISISLGGMVSVEWMKRYPNDFQQATLINTSFGGVSPVYKRLRPTALAQLLKVLVLKGRQKESLILEVVTNHRDKFEETLDIWEKIDQDRPVSLENTFRQLTAAATFRIGNFVPKIPVLILGSTQDRMVSVDCSREISKKWKTTIFEHPTGGHELTVDDPQWIADRIKDFSSQLA